MEGIFAKHVAPIVLIAVFSRFAAIIRMNQIDELLPFDRIVKEFITRNSLITGDSPVIIGLSGGADSVALTMVLHRLGFACRAAHCNFHLRGEESDRDEHFVRQFTSSLDIAASQRSLAG